MSKQKNSSEEVKSGLKTAKAGLELQTAVNKLAQSSGCTTPLTTSQRKHAQNEGRLKVSFANTLATRYEAHPEIAEPEFDGLRDDLATIAAYEAAAASTRLMLRSLQDQLIQKKGEAAQKSSALLSYMKGLIALPRGAQLRADVGDLTSLRRPPRAAKPKKAPADQPVAPSSPPGSMTATK